LSLDHDLRVERERRPVAVRLRDRPVAQIQALGRRDHRDLIRRDRGHADEHVIPLIAGRRIARDADPAEQADSSIVASRRVLARIVVTDERQLIPRPGRRRAFLLRDVRQLVRQQVAAIGRRIHAATEEHAIADGKRARVDRRRRLGRAFAGDDPRVADVRSDPR